MVSALNDAGVLVDISHVGNVTGRETVDASSQPIAITHGNPIAFCDSPRNKPDELVSAVAERGGVIGCTLYPLFMGGADVTRSEYCGMVAALSEQIGVEHVAIGSDAGLAWSPDARHWHYIKPVTSFIPRGDAAAGAFDCCGIFMCVC